LTHVLENFLRVLTPSGTLGLNFQVGRRSELVQRGHDRRFFEYYESAEVAALLERVGFSVDETVYGETTRNTHELDLILKWSTIYATTPSRLDERDRLLAGEAGENR